MPKPDKKKTSKDKAKKGDGKKKELKNEKSKVKKDKKKKAKDAKDKAKKKGPWYRDGLAFECTQCGACCSGEPGHVWVDEDEVAAMADEMGLDIENFEHKFTRQVGLKTSLTEYPDGDCILLDPETRKCTVYGARPIQCRTWPFWDSTLTTKQDWKETCEVCPGAGKGTVYSFEQIEAQRLEKSV